MKLLSFVIFLLTVSIARAQDVCNLRTAATGNIVAVDAADIHCIARSSLQKHTLFFTFAAWCAPCRAHLPNAIKTAKEHNLNFYVLLVEAEQDSYVRKAVDIIRNLDTSIKIAVLKDDIYGTNRSKKNSRFLTEITPPEFRNIDDYSKYILLDNAGKVIMVTSYKDDKGRNWRSDTTVTNNRIVPFLH